jgi:putative ABC transport system permease protein
MSLDALLGAWESGMIYALVALGVYISFRVLDFPDLTADGSFPLGGAVCAVCLVSGVNPWLATLYGALAGAAAGVVTSWLHVSLKIEKLLASILVMVALYSVNLRIMGAPNIPLISEATVFTSFVSTDGSNQFLVQALMICLVAFIAKLALDWFFNTQTGLAVRATGANNRMARAQGVHTHKMIILGMAISNGLIALAGALFVQTQGGADITNGFGTIVIGLAAVILGEAILPAKRMVWITLAVIIGATLYRLFIAIALGSTTLQQIGFASQDLNLVTALLVVLVMVLPKLKSRYLGKRKSSC